MQIRRRESHCRVAGHTVRSHMISRSGVVKFHELLYSCFTLHIVSLWTSTKFPDFPGLSASVETLLYFRQQKLTAKYHSVVSCRNELPESIWNVCTLSSFKHCVAEGCSRKSACPG